MVAQTKQYATEESHKKRVVGTNSANQDGSVGYCLNCGKHLTRCGIAFSADITCPACGAVNVYENSQQPIRLAA